MKAVMGVSYLPCAIRETEHQVWFSPDQQEKSHSRNQALG